MLALMGRLLNRDPNKVWAGNGLVGARASSPAPGQVWKAGEGRVSVRVFGAIEGRADRAGGAGPVRGNGGFLRFARGLGGSVERVMLNECPERRGNASVLGNTPLPVRQADAAGAGTGGCAPLRDPRVSPLPVAYGRNQIGEKFQAGQSGRANRLCLALPGAGNGRDIPSIPVGSGVRAAHCAGVNDRSARRPEFRGKWGLGEGLPGPCANGVNEAARLGCGGARVNQRA